MKTIYKQNKNLVSDFLNQLTVDTITWKELSRKFETFLFTEVKPDFTANDQPWAEFLMDYLEVAAEKRNREVGGASLLLYYEFDCRIDDELQDNRVEFESSCARSELVSAYRVANNIAENVELELEDITCYGLSYNTVIKLR